MIISREIMIIPRESVSKVPLPMTESAFPPPFRHCEERSDEAIRGCVYGWIASLLRASQFHDSFLNYCLNRMLLMD
jgi:hypothetical protein